MRAIACLMLLAAALFAAPAGAEISKKFGDYEVHYNVLATADLAPEVAQAYGIERSRNRGLLTVSVLKKKPGGGTEPVPAGIEASARSLAGQLTSIPMREIREQAAVYYIGNFALPSGLLRFNVLVRPEGAVAPFQVTFERRFY
ncbi:MAG TPA: DUF4426 domain-containing protein [Pelomicrobium sp.]|nr:DUF4426 domain-containing protein [Pelomicrobium sp.]